MQQCRDAGMAHEDVTRALVTCLMQSFPTVVRAEPSGAAYGPDEKTNPTGQAPPTRRRS